MGGDDDDEGVGRRGGGLVSEAVSVNGAEVTDSGREGAGWT